MYSVPQAYVGKTVQIKASGKIIQIFYHHRLIKQYPVAKYYPQTDFKDFLQNVHGVLERGLHRKLILRARVVGSQFHQLVKGILKVHAFLNLRRARASSSYPKNSLIPWSRKSPNLPKTGSFSQRQNS